MTLQAFRDHHPEVHPSVFIAPGAHVIGQVRLLEKSSIWFNCVLRGDINHITVGRYSNIQDMSVIHVTEEFPVEVGEYVVAGHGTTIHGCRIGNRCLIGMGAIVLSGAVIGDDVIIGAGALVPENATLEGGHLYLGLPCKKIRPVTAAERQAIVLSAERYASLAAAYRPTTEALNVEA